MNVTRTLTIDDLTPSELATLFTDMDDYRQAEFFAAIAPIAREWSGAGWCQQSCSIAQRLDDTGRKVVLKLAEHILGCDNLEALVAEQVPA